MGQHEEALFVAAEKGDKQAVDALLARKKSGAIALDVDWNNPNDVSAFVCLFVSFSFLHCCCRRRRRGGFIIALLVS